jgi:hypothetical protein
MERSSSLQLKPLGGHKVVFFSMESFSSLQLKPFCGHHFFFLGWKVHFICNQDHLVTTKWFSLQ